MKHECYNYLFKKLTAHNEQEMYKIVNTRIDELISKSGNPKMTLETLISCFEGAINISEGISYMSIAYGLVVGVFSLFSLVDNNINENKLVCFIIVVVFLAIDLALLGYFYFYKKGQKQGFILSVLKFRYEDLKEQKPEKKDGLNCNEDEKVYIVRVKRKQ